MCTESRRIIIGFVTQNYDGEGNIIDQDFVASDEETWEIDVDKPIDKPDNVTEMWPLLMVQP